MGRGGIWWGIVVGRGGDSGGSRGMVGERGGGGVGREVEDGG